MASNGHFPSDEPDVSQIRRMTADQRKHEWRHRKHIERMDMIPSRMNKLLGWAGWGSAIFIVGWMALYEDFGQRDNVFTDLRKSYQGFMKSAFNLSPHERSILGMDKARNAFDPNAFVKKLDAEVQAGQESPSVPVNHGKPS